MFLQFRLCDCFKLYTFFQTLLPDNLSPCCRPLYNGSFRLPHRLLIHFRIAFCWSLSSLPNSTLVVWELKVCHGPGKTLLLSSQVTDLLRFSLFFSAEISTVMMQWCVNQLVKISNSASETTYNRYYKNDKKMNHDD